MIANILLIIFFGAGFALLLYYVYKWFRVLWVAKGYLVAKCVCPSNANCENCNNYISYKSDHKRCMADKQLYKKLNLCLKWKSLNIAERPIEERVINKTW